MSTAAPLGRRTGDINTAARYELRQAGITVAEWTRYGSWVDGKWHGDDCGCSDDRCIGYHHEETDECQCLPAMIESYQREKTAASEAVEIWEAYQTGLAVDDSDRTDRARSRAGQWVHEYHGGGLTSWSLDERVDGAAGITVTNVYNDLRHLVWAAASAGGGRPDSTPSGASGTN